MESQVFLKVNERGETENVFATLGAAIDSINLEAKRLAPGCIKSKTLTSLVWQGKDEKEHYYVIQQCNICTNANMDYMNRPCDFCL